MRLSKVPVTIISFGLFISTVHAQFTLPAASKIEEMKRRQLVVVVNQPNQDIVNKYNRYGYRDAVRKYKQLVYDYNDNMELAVQKFWTFNSKEVLYRTWAETNDIINDKENRDKYVLMYCFSQSTGRSLDWLYDNDGRNLTGSQTYFSLSFPGEDPLAGFNIPFADIVPTAVELTFIVSAVNSSFEYVVSHGGRRDWQGLIRENAPMLSDETLLISKSDVSPKALQSIDIDYPCKFRLADDTAVTRAIIAGDSNYAYLVPFTFNKKSAIWIVNCADGSILGTSAINSADLISSPQEALKEEFFKDIANICKGKK